MAIHMDGATGPSTSFDPDAAIRDLKSGQAGVASEDGPLIPVRNPGKAYNAAGAGSVNALEHGLSDPAGRVTAMPATAAANAIFGWDLADQKAFAKKVWYLGGISSPEDIAGAWRVWQQAVQVAAGFAAADNPMDPQDVVDLMLTGDPDAKKNIAQRAAGGVVTQKARSINLSNPTEAKDLITQAFQHSMGRDPTDAEVRTLTASLQEAQRKNPSVTTQTAQYDDAGNLVSQNSTTSGGLDAQQFVLDNTQADPEAASYQAGTTYFNALMGALGPGA